MFTFALSNTGWALVGALGGALLGSIVGAVVTALLAAYLNHRRTSSLARAGARLLQGDFAIAGKQVESALKDGRWYSYMRWHDGNWSEYRGVLVERLDGDEFASVAQAARGLKEIFDGMPSGPDEPEGQGWMQLGEAPTKASELSRRRWSRLITSSVNYAASERGALPAVVSAMCRSVWSGAWPAARRLPL